MAEIITLTVGGLIAGSIYALAKALSNNTKTIDDSYTRIRDLRELLKYKRRHALTLKKQLMKAHNIAFEAWLNLKHITESLACQLKKAKQQRANKNLSQKVRENLQRSCKTLQSELNKAKEIKRKAHKKWEKLRVDYLATKRALELL